MRKMLSKSVKPQRIGIYSGTFDPVHSGHISFALQALKSAKLDRVIFLPERRPRYKHGVEHYAHRVAMLRQALAPYVRFEVQETDDICFTVRRTFHRLRQHYAGSQLVFLMGSDVVPTLQRWQDVERLLKHSELVVGLRYGVTADRVQDELRLLSQLPQNVHIMESFAPDISSAQVRAGLRARRATRGILASVARYSNRHWLYVSF